MTSGTFEDALKRALKFLSYRARTEEQVRVKLTQLGFPLTTVEATLERLRSLNFLNDETFARDWALTRATNHGYGLQRIARELRQKGISESLINPILQEAFAEQGERERAKALLQKRFSGKDFKDNKVLRRAIGFLQRRGYRDSDIMEALGQPLDDGNH
jgi:regulatory protein